MGLVSDTNQCSANNGDQETKLLMDNQVKLETINWIINLAKVEFGGLFLGLEFGFDLDKPLK